MSGEATSRFARLLTLVIALLFFAGPPRQPTMAQKAAPQATDAVAWGALSPAPGSDQPVMFEMVLQQGYRHYMGCQDAEMDAWYPQSKLEGRTDLRLRAWDTRAVLIKFDLTSISKGMRIHSARLALYALPADVPYALNARAFRVIRPWDVSEVTWEWAEMDDDEPVYWDTAGCNHQVTDRYAEPEGQITIDEAGAWHEVDITNLVEEWLANPALNEGLVIKADGGPNTEYAFAASEHSIQAWRPKLIINYMLATPTPTPTNTNTPTAMSTTPPTLRPIAVHTPTQHAYRGFAHSSRAL